jgi:hypothetical protein
MCVAAQKLIGPLSDSRKRGMKSPDDIALGVHDLLLSETAFAFR